MQAKDIDDATMLDAIRAVRGRHGVPRWSSWFDVQSQLAETRPDIPPKVALAKLRSMIKRKLIGGCGCGCRGDFEESVTAACEVHERAHRPA